MENRDSWATDSPGLSLTDTLDKLTSMTPFKRSEDRKGHSVPLGSRFPKEIARWVTKVKEQGQYQTTSDVIRDAVWLGLQILSLRYEKDPLWQTLLQLIEMGNDTAWEAKAYDDEEVFVSSLEKLCANGDEQHAIELVDERLRLLRGFDKRKRVLLERLKNHRLQSLLKEVQQ